MCIYIYIYILRHGEDPVRADDRALGQVQRLARVALVGPLPFGVLVDLSAAKETRTPRPLLLQYLSRYVKHIVYYCVLFICYIALQCIG